MATNNDGPTLAERRKGINEGQKAWDEHANKEWGHLYNAPAAPNHKSTATKPTQTTSGQSTTTATEPYVYEAKTSRRSTGLTPADKQKAIDKVTPKPRAQAEQPQVRRDATAYTPAVKQRPPMKSPTEQKREESQNNATPLKIMEAEALGIDKYNYQMELPQEFVSEFDGGDISKLLQHVSMSQDDDYNERLLEAAIRYVNTTYPNESVVEFNGKKYDKGSLAMALVPIMRENGHGYLMQNNANYRDDWAAKQGFGNFNVWLAAQDSELAKIQEEIDKAWKDKVSDDMVLKVGSFLSPINYLVGRDALGIKHIRDLRDSIDLMRNGDYSAFDTFMKGAEEGFDYLNMLTFDISGTAAEAMREIVLDKAYNGEELTSDEERILKIYEMEQEIKGYDHNTGSTARQLGNTMGYMGQELPQYLFIGGKIAGGVTNVFTKLTTKYTPNVVKGVVKATIGKNKIAPLRWGLKAAGDYASGLVAAPFTPGTYERFLEMRNEQFSIEDGKLKKDPTSAIRDGLKVWFEQAGEIGSERTGNRMADFLDSSLLSLGGELGVYKWLNKVKPTIGGVETSKALRYAKSSSHRAAQQAVQYTGDAFTEGLGEAWGSYTSEIMKEAVLGEGNFEQFYDADFWAMTFGASGLAGLGFGAPTTAMDWVGYYHDLRTLSGTKKEALSKIEHTDLKNALTTLSTGGSIKESTEHLANLDWKSYSRTEVGFAMDYIRAEAMQQVRMGEATEGERLQRFGKVAQAINNITYRDEGGKVTDSIITAMDKEGNTYYILEGDITNPESMLKALDKNGNTVSLLASNVSGYSKASVADTTEHHYKEMFSQEYNKKRLAKVQQAVDELINPPIDLLAQTAKRVGIIMPKEGDTITLVDGRTAKVTSVSDDLGIMAEMTDSEGNISLETIPIMQILSSNTYIAEVQKLQNAERALEMAKAEEAQMEAQDIAEENAEVTSGMGETTTEEVAEDGLIGTEVTLPNGNKGTIVEVDGNDVVVDTGRGVDAYEVYSKEELGMTETAETTTSQPTQTTAEQTTSETATEQTTGEVTPEQATEALNEIAGIKPVPTLEDGSIDYDAIDDAETFAKHFEHDMGGREEAIEGVKEMREQAMADLAEAEKKGKKARSANDKVANKKLREQLAERIAFYDNVLDVYSQKAEAAAPTESVAEADTTPSTAEVAEVAETTPQTMEAETTATPQEAETRTETTETTEEVAEEEALSAEEIWAAERREGYAVPNPKTGQNVGLVHNELSERLEKKVRVLLNDVATAFGASIVFQKQVKTKEGNNADGKIVGKTIYLSWGKRDNSLTWLTGHEFTHRMKSLAPEAYNRLRDAVRKFMGEKEWEFRIEEQRKKYEEATKKTEILTDAERVALHEEAIRQNTKEDGTYETKDVQETYDKLLAEARREAYIEEVVCDKVGDLVQDHNAFKQFVRSENVRWDKKLLNWIREVLQSIKGTFNHRAHLFNEMMTELDNLIAEATAKTSKGANVDTHERVSASEASVTPEVAEATERIESKGGEKYSLIGEVGAEALDRAEEATIRLDNLNIARQMEERGDSALDIRMATGWERGADGLWRYEIMDAEVNLYDGDENTIRKKIEVAEEEEKDFMQQSKADTKELRERTNRYLAEMREKYGVAEGEETDVMTEEEIDHLQSLTGKEVAFEDYKERRRNELYNRRMALEAQLAYVIVKNTDAPAMILTSRLGHVLKGEYAEQLFKAYPSLKDMEFRFVTDIQQRAFAAYAIDGGKPYIELNVKKTPVNMVAPYLMHEVQHAIQAIEGFAEGGSPAFLNKKLSDRLNAVTKELEKLRAEGKTEEADALVGLNKGLAEAVINNDTDDYGNYQKLMGEVEARNVSARINMTPEERRATLLSETEDVAREDQIFLRDGVEMAMAKRAYLPKEEYAKLASTIMTRQHTYSRPPFDYAKTFDNFYVYDYLGDGDSIINFAIPIIGNEDLITNIEISIDNGTITDTRSLNLYAKNLPSKQRADYNRFANAFEKRYGNRGYGVTFAENQTSNRGAYIEDSKRFGGDVATRGTSGNIDESANQELNTKFSLITPEMDASYLDAVERGDMATAQQMVMEAAKLAMPNTKVVDEDGNPKVVYHGTPNNFNAFSKEMFGASTDRGIWGNGFYFSDSEQYAKTYEKRGDKQGKTLSVFLNIKRPLFISLRNGGNEGAMYFHELMEKHFTDDIHEDVTRTDELMSVAQERLTADIVANGHDGIVVEYTNHIDTEYVAFEPNQIKSADPVTYDDNGNIIPLSERFNPEKEDIRYSLSEETTQIFDAAKAKFGTTYDMREAGYILPDGSMLDFSGRHQVRGGDTSFLNGDRTVDHREISDIAYDADDNETGISTDLGDFLDRGAIRIDSNAGAINLNVAPTKAQKDRLKRLIERNDGYVYVDFGKGWDTEHYAEYEAARASRVLGDIDRYFDEGIKPTGNVRYSLSNRPTGLLNDFADEFEALQKWYESLDTTTIHAQHPFRIRKRKVVQKYMNYVSKVLGHNLENIVYDKTNNSHVKKLYDKLKPYLKGTKEEDYSVFVESFRNRENQASYIVGTNIIIHEISDETAFMDAVNTLRAYIHENIHRIVEKLGIDEKTLEDILAEGLSLKPDITQSYIADYLNDPKHEQGEETLAYAIGDRILFSKDREKLLNAIEGNIAAKELFENQKISVPLRDSFIEKIVNELHNEYKSRREGEDSTGTDSANRGEVNKVDNQGLWREYSEAGSSGDIARRGRVLTPTRYSLQSGDMPFFNDNGDIITFDNTDITGEDYDAVELRSPMPTTPRTTEDVIKAHLSARHNAAKERIRRESRVLRDAVRKQYREEQIRRREGVESMRTNAAKVDYIIGAPIETLDYEAQVLAKIATGTLCISWESLKKELGVKDGDKKSYKHITKEATATLDAVVHDWLESINGYERGIDTQDLRNALIDVLMQVPTAKGALSILEDRFDHALRNRDEALEDIDREEERLIAEEDARYNEQMTTLSDPARMREYIRQYEQTVGFHEELTAIEGTLRKMDSELKAVRKRAERAQMRSRASKQKQSASFKEVRETIAEGKRALLEALSTYEQLGFNKQEVRSLVDAVNKARSMADINKVRVKIENVILNVSIREKRRHMDQMLNLRLPSGELVETWVSKQIHDGKMSVADGKRILADMFRGTNANGVRVAKYVDDETARVMDFLRNNLVVPNHGAHYREKKDADGNVIGREYVPSREEEMGADELLQANNKRCNELLGKAVNGTITEEEKVALQARQLYEPYLFVANARAYVKGVRAEGEKLYEEIQRKKAELGDAYTKEERDADYAALEANSLHLVEAKTAYDDALTEYNETLSNVIMSGRDKLREFREAKEAHKAEVVGMAIRAIGGEARTIASQPKVAEKIAAWNRTAFHSTYWTFDTACREIDRFAPNGEGEFYKHFMGGWRDASNAFFTRTENHVLSICEAVGRITGSKRDPRRALRAFMRKADMTTVGSIAYKNDKGEMESLPLRISNALFTLAMWDQAQYREIMEKRGITKEQMEALKAKIESIDGRYIDFMEWVIDSFLPSTRLEYNEVHKQLFGASMDNIENYFPAKVVEGYRDEDIAKEDSGLPSTMTGSIITRQKHNNMPEFDQSFFSVLLNHIQNMDQWASFSPLVEDLNAVISNPEFKRLANTHMAGVNNDRTGKGSLWQIFKDTSAVAIGSYRYKTSDADRMISKFTGAWAASNITWRFSTALKQLSGITAVAVSGFGKTQSMFLKNMMLSPLAVKWAMENSPMLQKRFGDRFAGNEALMRKYGQDQAKGLDLRKGKLKDGLERVNDFIRFLTVDVGMTPNAAVDALVVAVTMKTVYDVELSNLTKGKPETATEEQKKYAMMKAEIFANETQQSGEGAYMSVPQAQRSVVTAALTTYLNASFASHRLRVQGAQDIYHWLKSDYRNEIDARYGKGAARKAAVKGVGRLLAGLSIDATFILMSRALSQGLWKLIIDWFDDTEDDDDEADPIDWNDIGKEIGLNVAFGGLLGGNIVTTLGNGFTFTPIPALDELKKDVFKALGWTDKKIKDGDYSIDLSLWTFGEIIFKYGYGLDPETMLNIARGIEGICRDKDPMAAMKILNTPQSMVNIIAGPRRDNETAKEYVERRARLEVLFAQPKYSELYDDEGKFIGKGKYDVVGGAKDYRLKGLLKEYNERQRATVMSKEFSRSEVERFKRIDEEYKKAVEPLGWEVGNKPQDDKVDKTGWKPIYPEGLSKEHYTNLKGIATEAEALLNAQEKWVGSDEALAAIIRKEYAYREAVIKGKRSPYEASFTKRGIEQEKDIEKKQNKYKKLK